jgi:HlyD family secretion protein
VSKRSHHRPALLARERPVESFEQLDEALRIITVRNWILLSVLFLTLGGFGLFSCFYEAPLKVDGRGIILEKTRGDVEPLLQVTAPAAGRLLSVAVKIGSMVEKDDVLAIISQSELRDEIKEAEADITRLLDEDARMTKFDEEEARSRLHALGELERTLEHNLTLDRSRLAVSRQIAAGDRRLNKQQMLNNIDTLKSRADADAIESGIGTVEARLQELKFDRLRDVMVRRREKLKRTLGIQAAEMKLAVLNERLERDTKVRSPYAGKVVDLMMTPHALVEKGAPTALLQPQKQDEPLEAIVFVPAGLGKKIQQGYSVEVSPDTVRRAEHGFVRGQVLSISEIPATEMAMIAELKHKTLVANFVEQYQGQVLLSIRVKLFDVRESEGFGAMKAKPANWLKWSSSSGSRQRVSTGTLCAASIVVERRPLVALAIPWVRQLAGIY